MVLKIFFGIFAICITVSVGEDSNTISRAIPTMRLSETIMEQVNKYMSNYQRNMKFEIFQVWDDKKESLRVYNQSYGYVKNSYRLCFTGYDVHGDEPQQDVNRQVNTYGSQQACNKELCARFKKALDELSLCEGDSSLASKKFVVDEANTRCQTIQSSIVKQIFRDVCLCAFVDRAKMKIIGYLIYEVLSNVGIFHYFRIVERAYNIIIKSNGGFEDQHINTSLNHWVTDKTLHYRQLFKMEHQTHSDCQTGIFKMDFIKP